VQTGAGEVEVSITAVLLGYAVDIGYDTCRIATPGPVRLAVT